MEYILIEIIINLLILNIPQVSKYKFCTFHGTKEISLETNITWFPGNGYHYRSNHITKNSEALFKLLIDLNSFIFNSQLFKASSF